MDELTTGSWSRAVAACHERLDQKRGMYTTQSTINWSQLLSLFPCPPTPTPLSLLSLLPQGPRPRPGLRPQEPRCAMGGSGCMVMCKAGGGGGGLLLVGCRAWFFSRHKKNHETRPPDCGLCFFLSISIRASLLLTIKRSVRCHSNRQ